MIATITIIFDELSNFCQAFIDGRVTGRTVAEIA